MHDGYSPSVQSLMLINGYRFHVWGPICHVFLWRPRHPYNYRINSMTQKGYTIEKKLLSMSRYNVIRRRLMVSFMLWHVPRPSSPTTIMIVNCIPRFISMIKRCVVGKSRIIDGNNVYYVIAHWFFVEFPLSGADVPSPIVFVVVSTACSVVAVLLWAAEHQGGRLINTNATQNRSNH